MFALPQVEYLGYIVSRDGIRASPAKTRTVRNFPVPRNAKEVRSFLGLASFYRLLVPNFAQIAKPMSELLHKEAPLVWSECQQTTFENLKQILCSEQVLTYPNFDNHFILTIDASKVTVSAILSQVQDGVERPISFASCQMNPTEQCYSASEAEI